MGRLNLFKAAFYFLQIHHLIKRERERDLGTFVDEEEGDTDDENDVELDGTDQLDLDLDSEENDKHLESNLLSDSQDRADSMVPNSSRTGPKLENNNLLHSSPPIEFFKLFITDDFVSKMAEQTNFYAVQRGAPGSFKTDSHGTISLYLYINIHTDCGRRPETLFFLFHHCTFTTKSQ